MGKSVKVHGIDIPLPTLTKVDPHLITNVEMIPLVKPIAGAPDAISLFRFHLDRNIAPPFTFLAGEHFNLMVENFLKVRGEKERIGRSLSFASSPLSLAKEHYFDTMVLYEAGNAAHDEPPGALTTHLFHPDFKPQHIQGFSAPIGGYDGFVFTEALGKKLEADGISLCFLGGNVGVGPLLSMILTIKELGLTLPMLLITSSKTEHDLIVTDALLERLGLKGLPNLAIHHTVTRDAHFQGTKGRINIENLVPPILASAGLDLHKTYFYACGGAPFAESMDRYLTGEGEVAETLLRGDEEKTIRYQGLGLSKAVVFVEGFTSTAKMKKEEIEKKLHTLHRLIKTQNGKTSREEVLSQIKALKAEAEKIGQWKEGPTHLLTTLSELEQTLQ